MSDRPFERIAVECYAGHRAEETPRRFHLGPRAVAVVDVLDRWLAPDHRYFKLRGDDGDVYIIRHDVHGGLWELTMFERGNGALTMVTGVASAFSRTYDRRHD